MSYGDFIVLATVQRTRAFCKVPDSFDEFFPDLDLYDTFHKSPIKCSKIHPVEHS